MATVTLENNIAWLSRDGENKAYLEIDGPVVVLGVQKHRRPEETDTIIIRTDDLIEMLRAHGYTVTTDE